MILYFAGNVVGQDQALYDTGVRHKLLTFAEVDDWGKDSFEFWLYNHPPGAKIFLDSGAFSAYMRGAVVSLDRYIRFCHQYLDRIEVFVQLDKIGDPATTKRNLATMESEGLHPIPVYTSAAPIRELEALCERYKHIALGGLRGKTAGTNAWRRDHFNKIFQVLGRHWPVKTHAFGITSQWALERYPFHSADSSSAIVGAGMGRVMAFDNGVVTSEPWVDYARRSYNGEVVDVIGDTGTTATLSAHMGRRKHNIRTFLAFEQYLTRLWTLKGITWNR